MIKIMLIKNGLSKDEKDESGIQCNGGRIMCGII